MTNIKEEFENAFVKWHKSVLDNNEIVFTDMAALWAAKWMAERCAELAKEPELCVHDGFCEGKHGNEIVQEILQLKKELQ